MEVIKMIDDIDDFVEDLENDGDYVDDEDFE